jgi:hypothetical protein
LIALCLFLIWVVWREGFTAKGYLFGLMFIGLWRNLKQKMDERAITGEKIWDMRNRSTDDLGVLK